MREEKIAERYALALLEIGVDKKTFESLGHELDRTTKLFASSRELRQLFTHPRFDVEMRKRVLGELLERIAVSPTCRNFLFLLVDRGRILSLDNMVDMYHKLVDKHLGRVRARVIVAQALNLSDKRRLVKLLTELTDQKEVILVEEVDPSIIGGVVAEVDGRVFDGSLRSRLNNLGVQLRSNL